MFIRDQSGLALPTTIIIIVVLTLLGIALFRYSMAETKQVHWDENTLKAHYLARSGADAVAAHLIENPEDAEDLINEESGLVDLGDGQFRVFVTGDPSDEIHIKSTGLVGQAEQQAEQTVVLTLADAGPPAIHSNGNITLTGSSEVIGGDVSYQGLIVNPGGNVLSEEDIAGHVKGGEIEQKELVLDPVILPCEDDGSPFYSACPSDPQVFEGDNITESVFYEREKHNDSDIGLGPQTTRHLTIEPAAGSNLLVKAHEIDIGNNTFEVTLNNNTVAVVAHDFDAGNGAIKVNGSGDLLIYITGNYSGGGNFLTEKEDDVNVFFFVVDGGSFDLGGTANFDGAIYAPNADVSIGGNVTLTGWLIGNNVQLSGNASVQYTPTLILPDWLSLDFNFFRVEKYRYDY